jgi:hypothetical protein
MSKGFSIVIALGLAVVGLCFAAAALVALVYSFSSELPPGERLPTLLAGMFFGLLTVVCFGSGVVLVVKAMKRPAAG